MAGPGDTGAEIPANRGRTSARDRRARIRPRWQTAQRGNAGRALRSLPGDDSPSPDAAPPRRAGHLPPRPPPGGAGRRPGAGLRADAELRALGALDRRDAGRAGDPADVAAAGSGGAAALAGGGGRASAESAEGPAAVRPAGDA